MFKVTLLMVVCLMSHISLPLFAQDTNNQAPTARTDIYQTTQNKLLFGVNVLENDSDPDGDILSVESVKLRTANAGELNVAENGDLTFHPAVDFTGDVRAQYRITDGELMSIASMRITVHPAPPNQLPVPTDDIYQIDEDQVLSDINVLGNDDDPDGDLLTVVSSTVSVGTLTITPEGELSYNPPVNFFGNVTGEYVVSDGEESASANITIQIAPVNDRPLATDDLYQLDEDQDLSGVNVLANDNDPEGDSLTVVSSSVSEGTLTITTDGVLAYSPPANFFGNVLGEYTISDGDKTNGAEFNIEVMPINDQPIARPDSYEIEQNETLSGVNVLINDSDPDGDALSVESVKLRTANAGELNIAENGDLTFHPAVDFTGDVRAQYRITDGELMSIVSMVITVNPALPNQSPVPMDDIYQIDEDQVLSNVNVLVNDNDPDGGLLTVVSSTVSVGSLTITPEGELSYNPPANFFGNVTGEYVVSDGDQSVGADLSIDVAPINDPPSAQDDMVVVNQDSTDNILAVLDNDQDIDDAQLSIKSANAAFGLVSMQGQSLLYTPPVGYVGNDTVDYEIEDAAGLTDTAEVAITVRQTGSNNDVSAGRPVILSYPRRVGSSAANAAFYPADFTNWSSCGVDLNANSPQISNDGKSVRFSRATPNDGAAARSCLAFSFGPRYTGGALSITFDVTELDESASGTRNVSLNLPDGNLTGTTTRTPTSTGTWSTVVSANADANTTTVQIGFGVTGNDTRTNSLTIKNVLVTHLQDDDVQPNEYADVTSWAALPSAIPNAPVYASRHGFNGFVLAGDKQVTYNPNTGETNFNTPSTDQTQAINHVLMVTDSFGARIFGYARQLFYGGIDGAPDYAFQIHAQSGRELQAIAPNSSGNDLLQTMFETKARPDALQAGILAVQMGVNDFVLDSGNTATSVLAYAQEYIDWAQANNLVTVLSTATPFKNNANWTADKQTELDAYNAALLALHNGQTIFVQDNYAMLDQNGDDIIDDGLGSTDNLHVGNVGYEILYTAYDTLFKNIIEQQASTNQAPTPQEDSYQLDQGQILSNVNVLENDEDPDGDLLSVMSSTVSTGTLVITNDGALTYTPLANFSGNVSGEYVVSDGDLTATAAITITVNPVGGGNQAPAPVKDQYQLDEDTSLSNVNVLDNDNDPNGDSLAVVGFSVQGGTLEITSTGELTYTPPDNYFGVFRGSYDVSDGQDETRAVLEFTVNPVSDGPPIAQNDSVTVDKNSTLNRIAVLLNDYSLDDANLSINENQVSVDFGSVSVVQGSLLYTPPTGFVDDATITYQIQDSEGRTDQAQVAVTVREPSATSGGNPSSSIVANIKASRTDCVSPCTVVFSADATTAQGLDDHGIWSQLIYYWDFDTDESDTHGGLYSQTYHYVAGDSSHEIGGPMATKTFLCDTGTCTYNIGLRAQNADGDFNDDEITIEVTSEAAEWPTSDIVCVSNTLNTSANWTDFDKACPAGATKQNVMLDADDYADKLILLKKGDSFAQNIATMVGQSNFKIGYFGDSQEARPEIIGQLWIGTKRPTDGPLNAPNSASLNIINSDLDMHGSFPENVTIDGLRVGTIQLGMSYQHMGMHDLDMDWESSNISNFGRIQLAGNNSLCTDVSTLDCDRVPFPKGAYLSQTKMVGSEIDENTVSDREVTVGFNPVLNVAGIGCSMINYTGIVDTSMRKVREHNIRLMGWYRLNIMRSELLGQHKQSGKQKITIRSCIEKDVVANSKIENRPDWRTRADLPPNWNRDLEGRTRQDQWFADGTDDYVKLSRYALIQNNVIGDNVQRGLKRGSTKVQTNVTSENEETQEDVLITKNVFRNELGNDSIDISMPGLYGTCVDNTYSDNGANCTPTNPDADHFMRRNPTPLTPPLAPGS